MLSGFLRAAVLLGLMLAFPAVQVAAASLVSWPTDAAAFAIETNGSFASISRRADARNYLAASQLAPLLSVRVDGTVHAPDNAVWDAIANRLTLRYSKAAVTATLRVELKSTHLTLELVEIRPAARADLVLWGPYPTTIRQGVSVLATLPSASQTRR